jgi:hypothetical protein
LPTKLCAVLSLLDTKLTAAINSQIFLESPKAAQLMQNLIAQPALPAKGASKADKNLWKRKKSLAERAHNALLVKLR